MSREIVIRRSGPGLTVQDLGRPGYLAAGLSRGGAADRPALIAGAALLGNAAGAAAFEIAGGGTAFEVTEPMRIALTGAEMAAKADDRRLAWNASHRLEPGTVLTLGPASSGVYGYLHVAGGLATAPVLGSRATHVSAGLGPELGDGTALPVGDDPEPDRRPERLEIDEPTSHDPVRILPTAQTDLFEADARRRFEDATFTRDPRGDRKGVRLTHDGAPFATKGQRTLLSEAILPGDVQMTGDGTPFVLMPDCQTTGGYPRIATVHPADLHRVAQSPPGTPLTFRFVTVDEALAEYPDEDALFERFRDRRTPLVRDPRDIPDLLGYQLISGVTAGGDTEERTRHGK